MGASTAAVDAGFAMNFRPRLYLCSQISSFYISEIKISGVIKKIKEKNYVIK
jgi:hypothetical protein